MKRYVMSLVAVVLLSFSASVCRQVRIVLTAALSEHEYEFRKNQYIQTLQQLKQLGYMNIYIVEALKKKGPTFLDDYCDHVFYATVNDPTIGYRHNGINEARTLLEGLHYFGFNDDDVIIKLTGRYQLITNDFFEFVIQNPTIDVFIKYEPQYSWAYTLCFAMQNKYLIDMLESMDYEIMKKCNRLMEQEVYSYINALHNKFNCKICIVDQLCVRANMFGSTCGLYGTPAIIADF